MTNKEIIIIVEEIKRRKGIDRAMAENAALLANNRQLVSNAVIAIATAITKREINEEIIKRILK